MAKQQTILVVHGSFGSPWENWIPSTIESAKASGWSAFAPHLPSPDAQTYETWASIVDSYVATGLISTSGTFVGHSSGAAFLARYIADRNMTEATFISVAGFNNFFSGDEDFDRINSEFFIADEELARVGAMAGRRVAFWGDNDPHLPLAELEKFSSLIEASAHVIPDGGHLNSGAGFTEFGLLVDAIRL